MPTKKKLLTVPLSDEEWAKLRAMAEGQRLTEFVRGRVFGVQPERNPKQAKAGQLEPPQVQKTNLCLHTKRTVLNGGIKRCDSCGEIVR